MSNLELPQMNITQYFPLDTRQNTELNDLRKIICLRKSEVYVKKKTNKKLSNVTEKLVEHGIHCLPCSYTNDPIDLSS